MSDEGVTTTVGRGIVAGLVGTAVMTAFQKLVEMPITGRAESYAPASFAEKVLPIRRRSGGERRAVNYAAHFGIGTMWGVAFGLAERADLRGQRAVATVFGAVYTGDAILNTALGLYKPWRWSLQDWVIDVGDKLIQAEATGLVYQRLAPTSR
ncbi:MAG: hypothetical protein H0T39_04365 [Actinobacteria bacterium]|nr:hypothetical protein [Actinomycetota bacterium]